MDPVIISCLGGEEDAISKALDGGTKQRSSRDVVAEALGQEPKRRELTFVEPPILTPADVVSSSPPHEDDVLERLRSEGAEEFTSAAWCRGIIAGAALKDNTEAFVEKITKRTARGLGHGRDLLGELPPSAVVDVSIDHGERVGRPPEVDCQVYGPTERGTYQILHRHGHCLDSHTTARSNKRGQLIGLATLTRRDISRARSWNPTERMDTPNYSEASITV
jgi:hypothetical protein